MTRDERIASIRVGNTRVYPTVNQNDVAFLLAELDAAKVTAFTTCPNCGAGLEDGQCRECIESDVWLREQNATLRARVQRLTDALTAIDCAYRLGQTCIEANRRPELMCSRCAALAEGEYTRG